jgi:Zn-dependent protease with chaperone function
MMTFLAFLLECSAVVAFVATAVSLLATLASRWLPGATRRLSSALRADLAFLLGLLPAGVSLAVLAATVAPSVASVLGLAEDHCLQHGHHLHLCLLHASDPRPALALVGAAGLALFLFRAGALVWRTVTLGSRLSALERLGTPRPGEFPIISIPGAPHLCHATGLLRRRILLSASLSEALSPEQLRSALAHEAAHLHRRDPLAGMLLSVAGLFVPPFLARFLLDSWRMAAEEACDAEAAHRMGDGGVVAEALLVVARLRHQSMHPAGGAPAFGELALERRVRLLLDGGGRASAPARALVAAALSGSAGLFLALAHASFLHHAVETLLHQLF